MEPLTVLLHLLRDLFHADDAGHQQAGGNGCNGHHDRVGQKVEEVQKLHPEHGHPGQRAVAQCRQAAQRHHDGADEHGGAGAVPAQLVLKGGNSALGQGDGAGNGCKQHQHKEQHTHHSAQTHTGKHLGDGDEHQRRAGLQGVRVAAGEGEHRRDDHQTCHDGNGGIEHLHILGGLLDGDVLLHIGAKGDQNAHGDGQRIEHLPHGGDYSHPRKVFGVGHQKVLYTRQCAGTGDRVARNDQRQHHQHRHHHLGNPLHAVAHTGKDNAQREQAEQQKGQLGLQAVGDKGGEVAVRRQIAAASAQILGQIVDDPAADDRIIRHDQNGDNGVDPAAEPDAPALAEVGVGADRAFVGHAAQCSLGHDHGITECNCQQNVYQQENTAAVFGCQIREAPDVAQTHRSACGRQHEPDLTGERAALVLLFHVLNPLFLSAIKIKQNKCTTSADK